MNRKQSIIAIVILALFSSCATSYKTIRPETLGYPPPEGDSMFSYKYNVLLGAGNRKLAKKEMKKNVNVVAIRIINKTGQPLVYGQNFSLYSGGSEVTVLDPVGTTTAIKQMIPTYLFYLLLTPTTLEIHGNGKSSSTPVGLVIGPGLTILNMAVAAGANKRFKEELIQYSLINRTIASGETFYGLIGVTRGDFTPLSLKLKN